MVGFAQIFNAKLHFFCTENFAVVQKCFNPSIRKADEGNIHVKHFSVQESLALQIKC